MNRVFAFMMAAVSGSAPTVSSISPNSGSTGGGDVRTVSGTGFVMGATVTIGGAPCTGVSVVNATTITLTTPSGSGVADVVVTNPDTQTSGASGDGLYTYSVVYDFTTMALSGLWMDSYNGTDTWASVASAGTSGTGGGIRDFTDIAHGLTAPAHGSTLNGHTTVRWNRANSESLRTTGTLASEFIPTDLHKWSFGILLNVINVSTNHGGGTSTYLNESYIAEFGGNWNVSAYSSGPTFTVGTWPTSSDIVFPTGTLGSWVYLQARGLAGGDTQVRINGGAWTSVVGGSGILSGNVLWAGRGNTADYVNATVALMWIADASLSDADFDYSLNAARAYSNLPLT